MKGSTSNELIWYKRKPSVSHLRVFGLDAYVHVPKEFCKKLNSKSRKGVFMGYSPTSKAYCVWNNELRSIEESHNVIFHEDISTKGTGGTLNWLSLAHIPK